MQASPNSGPRGMPQVRHVVVDKVGRRRGKELLSPVVLEEGSYAAIRRVQEARQKEVLQVAEPASRALMPPGS